MTTWQHSTAPSNALMARRRGRARLLRRRDRRQQHSRIQALVYIAALAPDEGETVADVFYRDPPHPLAPTLQPDADGWIWLPTNAFADAFAQHASPARTALLAAVQRPIATACIQHPVATPSWRTRPCWYLIAEEDRMINPETQHFMAERMGARTQTCAGDHAPLVTDPAAVTDVVTQAVAAVAEDAMQAR